MGIGNRSQKQKLKTQCYADGGKAEDLEFCFHC